MAGQLLSGVEREWVGLGLFAMERGLKHAHLNLFGAETHPPLKVTAPAVNATERSHDGTQLP